jgi:DNA-binding MarR family transcriptional regulator
MSDAHAAWVRHLLQGVEPAPAERVAAVEADTPRVLVVAKLPQANQHSATDALLELSRAMTAIVAGTLAQLDDTVTVSQLRILVMLRFDNPVSLTTIAQGLGVDRSNASRACDKLVNADLVQRVEDKADRRRIALSLTAKGRRLVDSLMRRRRKILDELVGQLETDQQAQLARGLAALNDVIEKSSHEALSGATGAILPWIR